MFLWALYLLVLPSLSSLCEPGAGLKRGSNSVIGGIHRKGTESRLWGQGSFPGGGNSLGCELRKMSYSGKSGSKGGSDVSSLQGVICSHFILY